MDYRIVVSIVIFMGVFFFTFYLFILSSTMRKILLPLKDKFKMIMINAWGVYHINSIYSTNQHFFSRDMLQMYSTTVNSKHSQKFKVRICSFVNNYNNIIIALLMKHVRLNIDNLISFKMFIYE